MLLLSLLVCHFFEIQIQQMRLFLGIKQDEVPYT
jgi:hypothetical protein